MPNPRPSKLRYTVAAILTIVGIMGGWHLENHLMWTTTNSLKNRIYYIDKITPKTVKKGDYVIFQRVDPLINGGKPELVTKKAACVGGETLMVQGSHYICGTEYLGQALTWAPNGTPLKRFLYAGIIPQGKIFACGDHSDSYDSRYWGFLDVSEVKDLAHPIW